MEAIKDVIGYNKRPLTSSSKVREEHLSLGKINQAVMLLKIIKVYQKLFCSWSLYKKKEKIEIFFETLIYFSAFKQRRK